MNDIVDFRPSWAVLHDDADQLEYALVTADHDSRQVRDACIQLAEDLRPMINWQVYIQSCANLPNWDPCGNAGTQRDLDEFDAASIMTPHWWVSAVALLNKAVADIGNGSFMGAKYCLEYAYDTVTRRQPRDLPT